MTEHTVQKNNEQNIKSMEDEKKVEREEQERVMEKVCTAGVERVEEKKSDRRLTLAAQPVLALQPPTELPPALIVLLLGRNPPVA